MSESNVDELPKCDVDYRISFSSSAVLISNEDLNENALISKVFKPFEALFTHQVIDQGGDRDDDEEEEEENNDDEDPGVKVFVSCKYTCLLWDALIEVECKDPSIKEAIKKRISRSFVVPINHFNSGKGNKVDGFTFDKAEFEEFKSKDDGYSDLLISQGKGLWEKKVDESYSYQIRRYSVGSEVKEESEIAKLIISRGQAFATWFIENASPVDLHDPRWSVFALFLMKNGKPIVMAGYTTIFEFTNPIKKRKLMRLCQIVVAPPFQKLGLGKAMLLQLYAIANSDDEVFEVNVEDPCDEFTNLRNHCDTLNCMEKEIFFNLELSEFEAAISPSTGKLLEKYAEEARKALKINRNQAQICFDAAWLNKIRGATSSISSSQKAFRLSIKRRFYDEVVHVQGDGSQTQDDIKAQLEDLYQDYYSTIFKILEGVNKSRNRKA